MWCLFLLRLIQPAGKSYFTSSLGAQLYFLSLKSAAVGQALSGCDKSHLRNEGRYDILYRVINSFDAKTGSRAKRQYVNNTLPFTQGNGICPNALAQVGTYM